jgi:hypothetical protein
MKQDTTGAAAADVRRRFPLRTVVVTAIATTLILAVAVVLTLRGRGVRTRLVTALGGTTGSSRPVWPGHDTFGLRHQLITDRDAAIERGELATAAAVNALFSQEALGRAAATQRAWMGWRNATTRLFPESDTNPQWNYRNTAADLYGFLLHAGLQLEPETLPALWDTLAAETALAPPGELCQPTNALTGKPVDVSMTERMFASTEYVKDGLLSVYERWGSEQPSADRMMRVLDVVIARSPIDSTAGKLPAMGSEENGNVVQACARLALATGRDSYAQQAAVIAAAAVDQMLPACNGLPVVTFDYAAGKARDRKVRIRDHGNEIIPGLAEAYALAVQRGPSDPVWKARADHWAEPIARMFELLLQEGLNRDGVPVSVIDSSTGQHVDPTANDNWGYFTNGVLLFTEAARRHGKIDPARLDAMDAGVDRVAAAVARQYGIDWVGVPFDGYADTIESALYTAHYRPQTAGALLPWADDQIALLMACQKPDGFVSRGYLDGNFIRTLLMYADARSGGWRVVPWRADVRVGFARSGDAAVLMVSSAMPYTGTLVPDQPRHRTIMHLPWDWPRLNSWPEWFTPDEIVSVTDAIGVATPTRDDVSNGLPITLPANGHIELRFRTRSVAP